jgi:hypothetical protein
MEVGRRQGRDQHAALGQHRRRALDHGRHRRPVRQAALDHHRAGPARRNVAAVVPGQPDGVRVDPGECLLQFRARPEMDDEGGIGRDAIDERQPVRKGRHRNLSWMAAGEGRLRAVGRMLDILHAAVHGAGAAARQLTANRRIAPRAILRIASIIRGRTSTCRSREGLPRTRRGGATDMAFPPLVIVSQAHRSGGSLTAQLFDDHPELFAHPFEIHIGHPDKWMWPDLDLGARPTEWIDCLFERKLEQFVDRGFFKAGSNAYAAADRRPFAIDLEQLRSCFVETAGNLDRPTQRDILDCYFAAFFAARRTGRRAGA